MDIDKALISQEILKRLGVKFKPESTKQMISCWEHSDRHPSMSVDLEKGIYHCFSCSVSGTLANKYWETFHRSIYKDLGLGQSEIDLLKVRRDNEIKADFNNPREVDVCLEGKLYNISITEAGKNWLKKRGLIEKDLRAIRASYCQYGITKKRSDPTNKKEWIYVFNRVVIPIYEKGNILSYELRDIMGSTHYEKQLTKRGLSINDYPYKKLLYPKNSSVDTLFDLDNLKTDETLYVTEGIMDTISIRTHPDFKNSTCLFHNTPTERQYFLLNKFDRVVYLVNLDVPGLVGCKKLMERNKKVSFLCPPATCNDINEILQGKDSRFKTIKDLVDFGWLKKTSSNIKNIEQKIKLYSEAK